VAKVDMLAIDGGFALDLMLSDRSTFFMVPTPLDPVEELSEEDPVADWELFTPHGRYLRVGPGLHWSYLASNDSGESQK
jgi:hypothetical protein